MKIGSLRWWRVLLVAAAVVLVAGLSFLTYRTLTRPTTVTIAAGSIDGEGAKLMSAIATQLASSRSQVRLKVVDKGTALAASQAFSAGEADLAIVRGDLGDLSAARTVVLVTHGVLLMIALPGAKIEGIDGLKGKTVGVVGGEVNRRVVEMLDKEYELSRAKVSFRNLAIPDVAAAIQAKQVQALLIVTPISPRYLAIIRGMLPRDAKQVPTLIAVESAGAIAAVMRSYESYDLPKGTLRGSPPIPDDDLTTLRVPYYLVANRKLSDDLVTDLTKAIMESRGGLVGAHPILAQISAPSTDKDADIPIHPGAAAYFSGDEKTIFDKYGDQFFYASMMLGMLSSIVAATWKFMTPNIDGDGGRSPERLHSMIGRIRQAKDDSDLEQIEEEIDSILSKELSKSGRGEMDQAALNIALNRLGYLIEKRRRALAALVNV